MPPELRMTHRASRGDVIGCLLSAVFFVAIGVMGHWVCIVENPVYHDAPILKKILMLVFIDGCFLFFVLFCIYGAVYTYYHQLIFDENGISEHGIRSVKTIRISEITAIQWITNQQRIKLRAPTTQITVSFEIFRRDKELTRAFIVFLRESVPLEYQKSWKQFCHRMEQSSHWRDKNAIPVPDPEKGEILYTRKMFNWTIPWMIIVSVVFWGGFAYFVYFINMCGYAIRDLPDASVGTFIFVFCLLWIGWWCMRCTIPKHGQIIMKKQLSIQYYPFFVMALTLFGFLFLLLFMANSSKSDDFWKQIILIGVIILYLSLHLPLFWIAHQKRKIDNRASESLPDDYMPKIFEKR